MNSYLSLSCRRAETSSSASLRGSRGPWRPRRRPTRRPSARGGPTWSSTTAAPCSAHNRVPLHGAEVEELKPALPVNFATAASEPASQPPQAVPCLVTAAATRVRRVQAILATSRSSYCLDSAHSACCAWVPRREVELSTSITCRPTRRLLNSHTFTATRSTARSSMGCPAC